MPSSEKPCGCEFPHSISFTVIQADFVFGQTSPCISCYDPKVSIPNPRLSPTYLIPRSAVKDGVLPLTTPIIGVDGEVITSIAVPKGTLIYIGMSAVNHSKKIWGEDALEFKPERWSNGKADSVNTKVCGVYSNTMTFIGGGRSCMCVVQFTLMLLVCSSWFPFQWLQIFDPGNE